MVGLRIFNTWCWALPTAVAAAALVILQDLLYGGFPSDTPLRITFAQYGLPWLTWALLAPLILLMFAYFPVDLRAPGRALGAYVIISIFVVGLKLVLTAPAAALLIWQPLNVSSSDGIRWLLAHRAAPNLIIFWMLLATYTGYRYYKSTSSLTANHAPLPLNRIPVRAGERTAFLNIEQVSYIEADRNQIIIHTADSQYSIRSTLNELEARLPEDRFLRIHRSRLVNIDRIEVVEPWGRGDYVLIMKDGTRLLSGKTYRDAVRRILHLT